MISTRCRCARNFPVKGREGGCVFKLSAQAHVGSGLVVVGGIPNFHIHVRLFCLRLQFECGLIYPCLAAAAIVVASGIQIPGPIPQALTDANNKLVSFYTFFLPTYLPT